MKTNSLSENPKYEFSHLTSRSNLCVYSLAYCNHQTMKTVHPCVVDEHQNQQTPKLKIKTQKPTLYIKLHILHRRFSRTWLHCLISTTIKLLPLCPLKSNAIIFKYKPKEIRTTQKN
jgi:hypothetical protein